MGTADLLADCHGISRRISYKVADPTAVDAIARPKGYSRYNLLFGGDNTFFSAAPAEMAYPG
jgi:hypothetical protein